MERTPESLVVELAHAAEAGLERHLRLLDELVAIPSHNSNPAGTDDVASLLVPKMERHGFTVERIANPTLPEQMSWIERIMMPGQKLENLGATYRATRVSGTGRRVLLLGDLDISFTPAEHRSFPPRRNGSRYFGPGVADMKGGLVILLGALELLADLDLPHPDLEIVLSADEQAGSLGSRHVIEASARRSDWTLCVECARRGGQLMASRGHIGIGDLTASGVEAHAGSDHDQGVNAIDFLARVIPPVNALSQPAERVLVTVTLLEAGRRRSVIPDKAWATIDIRTPDALAWEATTSAIRETVSVTGGGRVRARTYAHRPGVPWTPHTDELLSLIRRQGSALELELSAFASAAAGSSAFAAEHTVVMDGMGPVGGGLMTQNEHIEIESIPERAAILAATLVALGDQSLEPGTRPG